MMPPSTILRSRRTLMTAKDTTQAILRRAGAFFSGTMLSRITGMLRDILMAWAFGAGAAVASFMVAFRFSHMLRRILGEGAMQTAFIPQFVAARRASEERARHFFQNLSGALSLLLVIVIVLAEGILAALLSWDLFSNEGREICRLTMLMLPGLLFICLSGINGALLQCEGRYFVVSGAPVAFNLAWIAGVLALSRLPPQEAMPWLAVMITVACLAQWIVTVPLVRRLAGMKNPFTAWRELDLKSPDLRDLVKALSLGVLGVSASQINGAIDAVIATYASPEGPALLWYAMRLQQLPLALFGIALSGALLPSMARAIKGADFARGRQFLDYAIRQAMLVILPATLGLIVAGGAIVNLLFGHGEFTEAATLNTSWCLWAYATGLPAATLVLLLGPGFYALGDYATPTRGLLLSIGTNIILNLAAVGLWGMGPPAVAMATSVAAWLNVVYLHVKLKKAMGPYLTPPTTKTVTKVGLASVFASCVVGLTSVSWDGNGVLATMLNGAPPVLSRHFSTQMIECVTTCGLFGIAWFIASWILRLDVTEFIREEKLSARSQS